MKSHKILFIGLAIWLAQVLNSQASSLDSTVGLLEARQENAGDGQGADTACGFVGNADFYGVGVRVGFYLQWASNLIAWVFMPSLCEELADEMTIFLSANLIAAIVLSASNAQNTNVVVIILLFYMFFGSSVSAVTSAAASLDGWEGARGLRKMGMMFRQAFVQVTFLAMLGFSIWFWSHGLYDFKRLECGTYVFPIGHRLSLDGSEPGAAAALILLIIVYLMIWWVAVRRMGKRFEAILPDAWEKKIDQYKPKLPRLFKIPDFEERHWRYAGAILTLLVILWCIAGLELTLVNNGVTGVNYLGTTGQLIPFIIGAISLPTTIFSVVENYYDNRSNPANYEELHTVPLYERRDGAVPQDVNTEYHPPRAGDHPDEIQIDKRVSDTSALMSGKPSPALLSPDPYERTLP